MIARQAIRTATRSTAARSFSSVNRAAPAVANRAVNVRNFFLAFQLIITNVKLIHYRQLVNKFVVLNTLLSLKKVVLNLSLNVLTGHFLSYKNTSKMKPYVCSVGVQWVKVKVSPHK